MLPALGAGALGLVLIVEIPIPPAASAPVH